MKIDYQAWTFWAYLSQWIFNLAIAYTVWISRSRQALKKRIDDMEDKLIEVCADMNHMPGQQQFKELSDSITALNGNIKKLEGRFEGVNRAVDLINEFLIKEGGKRRVLVK